MKEVHINPRSKQRFIIFIIILCLLISADVLSQNTVDCDHYLLDGLLVNMEVDNEKLQSCYVVTDYYNKDISGNFSNKFRASGPYTRGLENDQVTWMAENAFSIRLSNDKCNDRNSN